MHGIKRRILLRTALQMHRHEITDLRWTARARKPMVPRDKDTADANPARVTEARASPDGKQDREASRSKRIRGEEHNRHDGSEIQHNNQRRKQDNHRTRPLGKNRVRRRTQRQTSIRGDRKTGRKPRKPGVYLLALGSLWTN